jgi:choline dehydrogenase-like flavoprotein
VVASRLSRSPSAPQVLLLEAGDAQISDNALILSHRYTNLFNYPQDNWNYSTSPQAYLNGREASYARGRGIGGSSRINFACYTIGPRGDFDYWAELVNDDFFNWSNARRRFDKIESYDTNVKPEYAKYFGPLKEQHGVDGPLSVSLPVVWERGLVEALDAANAAGFEINRDTNSGNPIGIGIVASTAKNGIRATSASYLLEPPKNLTIIANTLVTKILFEGKRAVGVSAGEKTCM